MTHDMKRYKTVLTIAGSDSGGGAGIQADIKTLSSLGIYATSVITSLTAQNTTGVKSVFNVPSSFLKEQLDAVSSDFDLQAIKIGMLGDVANLKLVATYIETNMQDIPVIFDPVMKSTSGRMLLEGDDADSLFHLMCNSALVTPNMDEAGILLGKKLTDVADMLDACFVLLDKGCRNVLIKGGHLGSEHLVDVLVMSNHVPVMFPADRISTNNLHGTGCTLSSAIAAYMALGQPLVNAVENAEKYIKKAIFAGRDVIVGKGNGPLNHFFSPESMHKS